MNLAYRDIRFNLGRFLLTCCGLSLLLGVVLSMVGIYRGLVEDALRLARPPEADIWVVEAGKKGPFAESSRIPGSTREMLQAMTDRRPWIRNALMGSWTFRRRLCAGSRPPFWW